MQVRWMRAVFAMAVLIAVPGIAADKYPTKPVRILAAAAAGGPLDIIARVVGQKLSEQLGQPFVVDARGGAGGIIATKIAAQGGPDGYTLLCNSSQYVVAPSLYKDPGYDPLKDFAPVVIAGVIPNILFVHPSVPAKNLAELIALLKKGLPEDKNGKKKILVVEDEFGLQETFRDVFIMEGYDVRVALDGDEGYRTYLQFKPDLLFTDVVMPTMSGIELVKKIRSNNPRIKVIYISGFFGLRNVKQELQEDVLKYGYHCLSKPFKISAMLELVDRYLNDLTGIDHVA